MGTTKYKSKYTIIAKTRYNNGLIEFIKYKTDEPLNTINYINRVKGIVLFANIYSNGKDRFRELVGNYTSKNGLTMSYTVRYRRA